MHLRPRMRGRRPEAGYILLVFLVILAALIISMTVAAPRLAQQIKRDRETEMIHRGEQYARAIKRYYKKFGHYPGRIEDLENTNTIRFLRKRYKDPMAKDGGWRILHYGEVQLLQAGTMGAAATQATQTAAPATGAKTSPGMFSLNFSGNSATSPATTPGGAATPAAAAPGAAGATPSDGTTPSDTATGTPAGASQPVTTTADTSSSGAGTASSYGQSSAGGSSAQTTSGQTTASTSSGQTTASTGSGSLFSGSATSAQPGAGGPIIGVASLSKAQGIHEFNNKSAFKDWLFIYDPAQDRGNLLRGPYNPKAFFGQFNAQTAGTSQPGQSTAPAGTGLSFAPSTGMAGAAGQAQGQPGNAGSAPAANPSPTQ